MRSPAGSPPVQEGQTVKVMVLSAENGKINLSIKRTLPRPERPAGRGGAPMGGHGSAAATPAQIPSRVEAALVKYLAQKRTRSGLSASCSAMETKTPSSARLAKPHTAQAAPPHQNGGHYGFCKNLQVQRFLR